MKKLTPDEIRQLAVDTVEGKVFTDRHLPENDDGTLLGLVFVGLKLAALSGNTIPPEETAQIGMIYEYVDKAGPRSVNGYPSFLSFHFLHRDDLPLFLDAHKAYAAARETAKAAALASAVPL